jgi:putative endopeptidase
MLLKNPSARIVFPALIVVLVNLMAGCGKEAQHGIDRRNMDLTTDPAQDFYQFVNGGWLARTEIPDSESRWGVFDELRDTNKHLLHDLLSELSGQPHPPNSNAQRVADFYASGMDSLSIDALRLDPIKSYLADISAIANADDILRNVARQQRMGAGPLYSLMIEGDFKDSDISAFYVLQGGLGMPDRDYYLEPGERFEKYRDEYVTHLEKLSVLLGDTQAAAEAAAAAVMKMETRLARASKTSAEMRNYSLWYNKYTMAEANKLTPRVDWHGHLRELGIDNIEYFLIGQPDFIKAVSDMLADVSIADWQSYLRWHLINFAAPYLSSDFAEQDFHFFSRVLQGSKEMKPRWKRISEKTDASLGEALGQLYVEKYFPPAAKAKANQMVTDLRVAFRDRIRQLTWMSDETKQNAYAKLDRMVQKIGYPDKWRDYSRLTIEKDAYVLNVIRANAFEFDRNINKVGNPVDKTEWGMTPPTVNAYFHPLNNEIVFPAGILQPPFFDPKADDAVNYGGMGAVIGHEITHGFDDQGSRFDADGNMANWWTEKDRLEFDKRTKVVEEQFNGYTVLDSIPVNGKLTIGENIADLGGLAVAHDALRLALNRNGNPGIIDGFTPEQRFFISWATNWRNKSRDDALLNLVKTDPHTPGHLRAIGPVANMPVFFEAFKIPAGAPMRRPDSLLAKIW